MSKGKIHQLDGQDDEWQQEDTENLANWQPPMYYVDTVECSTTASTSPTWLERVDLQMGDELSFSEECVPDRKFCYDYPEIYDCMHDKLSLNINSEMHECERDRVLFDNNSELLDINVVDKRPIVKMMINGKTMSMEFDSGASVSVCSKNWFLRSGLNLPISSSHQLLRVANGEVKPVLGKTRVTVTLNGKTIPNLELVIVDGVFPALLGRTWIVQFLGNNWLERLLELGCNWSKSSPKATPVTVSTKNCSLNSCRDSRAGQTFHEVVCPVDNSRRSGACRCYALDKECSVMCSCNSCCPSLDKDVLSRSMCDCPLVKSYSPLVKDLVQSEGVKDPGGDSVPADDTFTVESLKLSVPEKLKQNLRSIEELKKSEVFAEGLGLVRDFEAKLILKDGAQPVFMKSRQLPYAVKEMVHQELKTMADADILEKVEYSEWATPIVVVRNKIRICGDYKVTLNRVIETKHYPIPSVEECLNTVVGGSKFTVLDIKKAYNNLLIRSNDRKFTTINTPFGLFEWKRLPYGISNSGPIFQENIDHTLQGIPMTTCRVDDILISGKTDKEHLYNLNYVIMVLEYQGYRCNWEKSQIFRDRVVYLGHEVSQEWMTC